MPTRNDFFIWMCGQCKPCGENYSVATANNYANSLYWEDLRPGTLRYRLYDCCCGAGETRCYGEMDRDTLEEILDFMTSNQEAAQRDNEYMHRTTSAAIRWLIRWHLENNRH